MIQREVLVELLDQQLSTRRIAKNLGLNEKTVLYWERKYGLSPAFASRKRRRGRSLEEMEAAMRRKPIEYRRRLKARAIAHMGGRCVLCGYDRCNAGLEFHHLDRSNKTFGLSRKGITRSWDSTMKELAKCVLICANCHREVEAGFRTIPRGLGAPGVPVEEDLKTRREPEIPPLANIGQPEASL